MCGGVVLRAVLQRCGGGGSGTVADCRTGGLFPFLSPSLSPPPIPCPRPHQLLPAHSRMPALAPQPHARYTHLLLMLGVPSLPPPFSSPPPRSGGGLARISRPVRGAALSFTFAATPLTRAQRSVMMQTPSAQCLRSRHLPAHATSTAHPFLMSLLSLAWPHLPPTSSALTRPQSAIVLSSGAS